MSDRGEEVAYVRLSVDANNNISGVLEHSFPSEGGDVSSAKIEVSGSAEGEDLTLDREHFVEYDTVWTPASSQNGSSVWQATPALLSVDDETEQSINTDQLSEADCATVNAALSGSTATSPTDNNSASTGDSLPVGSYCYAAEQGDYKTNAVVSVKENNSIDGTVIHEFPPQGDSYTTRIDVTGSADGKALNLYTIPFTQRDTIWVPLLEQSQETAWTATPEMLTVDAKSSQRNDVAEFAMAECDDVLAAINPLGGVAAAPFGTPAGQLLTGYDNVRTMPIQFEPGASSATVSDSVVRKTADLYVLQAQANQTMNLGISSERENAFFTVVSPDGNILAEGQNDAEFALPSDGFYKVAVTGTQGNASYEMSVGIE